jgi:hypothetical protein
MGRPLSGGVPSPGATSGGALQCARASCLVRGRKTCGRAGNAGAAKAGKPENARYCGRARVLLHAQWKLAYSLPPPVYKLKPHSWPRVISVVCIERVRIGYRAFLSGSKCAATQSVAAHAVACA